MIHNRSGICQVFEAQSKDSSAQICLQRFALLYNTTIVYIQDCLGGEDPAAHLCWRAILEWCFGRRRIGQFHNEISVAPSLVMDVVA